MARLDVHPMSGGGAGYVIDVQAGLLSQHVLVTQAIATVPRRELTRAVASLAGDHDRITRALTLLLVGF